MVDALDKLIVDEKESLDTELLARLVQGYLRFTKEGEIFFERDFVKLKDWQKILIYLLGRKVIFVKKLAKDFKEEASPNQISQAINLPPKSIARCGSRELKGIIKSEKGNYKILNFNLFKCEEILKK